MGHCSGSRIESSRLCGVGDYKLLAESIKLQPLKTLSSEERLKAVGSRC